MSEYVDFHYMPLEGKITGKQVLKQTEDAINDLGNKVYNLDVDEERIDEAMENSEQAINTADAALAAVTTDRAVWKNTVAEMKATDIDLGVTAATRGKTVFNDGSGAFYGVRSEKGGDVESDDIVFLNNGNVAERIQSMNITAKGNNIIFVANVAELINSDALIGSVYGTNGYYSANDGGAGLYSIRTKTQSDVEDGGSIIFLDNGNVAELITDGTVKVKQFGAKGDGVTDDTVAIQSAFDCGAGVVFIQNGTYMIKTADETLPDDAGARLGVTIKNSNTKVSLDAGATLKGIPTNRHYYEVVCIKNATDVVFDGGHILCDRTIETSEFGHGILILNCTNTIVRNTEVSYALGDGIVVGGSQNELSDNVTLDNVYVHHCRRNGISFQEFKSGAIRNSRIEYTQGTAPQACIDIEPNYTTAEKRTLYVDNLITQNNTYGFTVQNANTLTLYVRDSICEGYNLRSGIKLYMHNCNGNITLAPRTGETFTAYISNCHAGSCYFGGDADANICAYVTNSYFEETGDAYWGNQAYVTDFTKHSKELYLKNCEIDIANGSLSFRAINKICIDGCNFHIKNSDNGTIDNLRLIVQTGGFLSITNSLFKLLNIPSNKLAMSFFQVANGSRGIINNNNFTFQNVLGKTGIYMTWLFEYLEMNGNVYKMTDDINLYYGSSLLTHLTFSNNVISGASRSLGNLDGSMQGGNNLFSSSLWVEQ